MVELIVQPRISETNQGGHIGAIAIPVWFEEGRGEFFKQILEDSHFNFFMIRFDVEFKKEIFYDEEVLIKTQVDSASQSSIHFCQQAWQSGELKAVGKALVARVDAERRKPLRLTPWMKEKLDLEINRLT